MGFSQPVAPGTISQVLEPLAKLQTCLCVFAQQERAANSVSITVVLTGTYLVPALE